MASAKRQFSCRPDDETWERIDALKVRIAAVIELDKLTDTALLRLAMIELERKYPAPDAPPARAGKEK